MDLIGLPLAASGTAGRLRSILRGEFADLAPLWDSAEVAALLADKAAALRHGDAVLRDVLRGALRISGDHLDATYELRVERRTHAPTPSPAERRFALVRLALGDARARLEKSIVLLSPDDPALDIAARLGQGSEILAHRFGSRIVWRTTGPDGLPVAFKMRRRRPAATLVLEDRDEPGLDGGRAALPSLLEESAMEGAFLTRIEWIDAASLHDLVRDGRGSGPGLTSAIERSGRALADLHRRGRLVDHGSLAHPREGARRRTADSEIESLGQLATHVERLFAGPARPVRDAIARLVDAIPARDASAPLVALHGDLHDKQILLDGSRVVFLDTDSAALGDPELELGNLAGHFVLRALQYDRSLDDARRAKIALFDGYTSAGGRFSRETVEFAYRATLLRLALLYRLRMESAHLFPALLDAEARASEKGRL